MPTYNRIQYLKLTLDYLLKEFESISHEVIIVDGGSIDGTLEYLEDLERKNRIVLIRQLKPEGAVRAFQPAIDIAQGEYITFRHDHSFSIKGPILKACRLMDIMPEIGIIFEKIYKYPRQIHKANIFSGYFGLMEAFIFRQSEKFQIDKNYVSYGWAIDKVLQTLCSGKIIAGLRQVSFIDTRISHNDKLHQKFKGEDQKYTFVREDNKFWLNHSEILQHLTRSFLPLSVRIWSYFWHWITFKMILRFLNTPFARLISMVTMQLGYSLPSIIPEYSRKEAGPALQVKTLDLRLNLPYFESLFDWLHQKCCPFLDNTLIPKEFRDDFYLVQKLPKDLVEAIAKEKIWEK